MAYETECDFFLVTIYNLQNESLRLTVSRSELTKIPEISNGNYRLLAAINVCIPILSTDGFITVVSKDEYKITDKGIAFLNTDSFKDRRIRWDVENRNKNFQYRMRYIPFFFSAISLGLAFYASIQTYKTQKMIVPKQEYMLQSGRQGCWTGGDTIAKK